VQPPLFLVPQEPVGEPHVRFLTFLGGLGNIQGALIKKGKIRGKGLIGKKLITKPGADAGKKEKAPNLKVVLIKIITKKFGRESFRGEVGRPFEEGAWGRKKKDYQGEPSPVTTNRAPPDIGPPKVSKLT